MGADRDAGRGKDRGEELKARRGWNNFFTSIQTFSIVMFVLVTFKIALWAVMK